MKKLSMLLALCLLAAALPLNALAEDVESAILEAGPGEAMGQTGALGLIAVPDDPSGAGADDAPLDPDEVFAWQEDFAVAAVPEEETAVSPEAAPEQADPAQTEQAPGEAGEAGEAPQTPEEPAEVPGPELAAYELTLGIGEAFDLKPALPEGVVGTVACAVDDTAVATVTAEGVVTAVAEGEALVTALCDNGGSAECLVTVKLAPDRVKFSKKAFALGKGEVTDALKVIVGSEEDRYAGAYKVSSNRKKIVKVNPDGTIEGVSKGKATLTVVTYNGKKATCTVNVVNPPKALSAAVDKSVIGVGETARITCKLPDKTASQFEYKSEAPEIAQVDPDTGEITGVAPGKARVRVRTFNKLKKYVTVKVLPEPTELSFPDEVVCLGVGMKLDVAAQVDEGAAGSIAYKVKRKAVASYAGGVLKGVAKGETVLMAQTYNGLTAQCTVRVLSAPKSVKLPYTSRTIGVGQTLQLSPVLDRGTSSFTYASSNSKVAAVSADGVIKGKAAGKATIAVKTYNNKTCKLAVTVLKAPGSITLKPAKLELCVGESAQVAYSLPKNTAAEVTGGIEDETIAKLDTSNGKVTGLSAGETKLTVTTHNGRSATTKIKVFKSPEWIDPDTNLLEMLEGEKHTIEIEMSPGSRSPLTYTSKNHKVATVSNEGVITAKGGGKTTIMVTTNVPDVFCSVSVTVWPAPGSVKFNKKEIELDVGDTAQLTPVIPEGSVTTYTYASSNEKVAKVSDEGIVTAVARGTAEIGVKTHNGKTAKLKLTVLDPYYPESVTVSNAPEYMETNSTYQLQLTTKPATAIPDLKWSTTDESIAWVDDSDVIHTSGFGYVKLSAVSEKNSDIKIEFILAVETDSVTLVIPERTTSIAGINANLAKIEAIHTSAINQLKSMYAGKVITSSDALKRKSIIDNAFKDYAFPWMTPEYQKYWKAENSENGAKDFKADRVYYGLPYISGSGGNRAYNAAKALSEARYTDSGKGYYLLNRKNPLNGKYCGNDCSCFVNAAIWGTNSSHSADRTADIAVSSAYKTVSGFNSMRPGDLICKGYKHVVMFLYYANKDKTQIMIIENGGIEAGTNTVHCMIMQVKYYDSNGYKVRRLSSLG